MKANREKVRERTREYYQINREKVKEKAKKWAENNPEKVKEKTKKWAENNPEKVKESERKYREKNREKLSERTRKWRKSNPEKIREQKRKWTKENPELVKTYARKHRSKNPHAHTEVMTKYRRSHKVCEWSGCVRTKSLHVHHILPKFNYPKYVDGDYHGKIQGNFICFCPLHHYAYHSLASKKDTRHKKALSMLWNKVIKWANKNKIPIEDVIAEIAQMPPPK